jgi:hypothetical protein
MTSPWWHGLAPAQATILCGGESHRVRWDAGHVSAPDHADLEGDRTLAVLAGQRCGCGELLEVWGAHVDDLRVLALASRGPADPITWREEDGGGVAFAPPVGFLRTSPRGVALGMAPSISTALMVSGTLPRTQRGSLRRAQPHADGQYDLLNLLTLEGGLPDRLVATVAATWAAWLEAGDQEADSKRVILEAALYGRVANALRAFAGDRGLDVDVTMIDAGEAPTIHRDDHQIEVHLPFAWVHSVWCRNLAVVLGEFVLAIEDDDEGGFVLTTAGPDLDSNALRQWRLSPSGEPGRR